MVLHMQGDTAGPTHTSTVLKLESEIIESSMLSLTADGGTQ